MADIDPKPRPENPPKPRRRFRLLSILWKLFVIYVMASVALSFIPEGRLDVEILGKPERAHFSGQLVAGTARRVITPPTELWGELNLYNEDPPIAGVMDDLYARVLTLGAKGSPERVAIVSMDMLVVSPPMRGALEQELDRRGVKDVHFMLCATHTHTGPGNFWDLRLYGRANLGKYSDAFFRFLIARLADAVEGSLRDMRPARIGFGKSETRYLVAQRRYKEAVTGLRPPADEELEVVRVDSADGRSVMAYVLNLGAHPTNLVHQTQRRVSGDYPGAISARLEKEHPGAVAVFLQGAVGSVRATSPVPAGGYKGIVEPELARLAIQTDMLSAFVAEAEANMRFEKSVDASSALIHVALPACDMHFFPEERPYLAVRVLTLIPNWVFNRTVARRVLPRETVFQALRVNHAYFLTFPCDLGNSLGWEIKQHVRRENVLVIGQSNDYSMGYVLSREEYDMGGVTRLGGSERGQCFYGKRAGPFCIKVVHRLVEMVKEQGASDVFYYRFGDRPGTVPGGGAAGDNGTRE